MTKILEADPEVEMCVYCGAVMPIEQASLVPAIGDDEAWGNLADYHYDGCEWIETRAHREATK